MPNTVSGTVFDDKDGDGTQGPNEPSLPGVNLRVVDLNAGGAVLATATTDAGGNYSIDASGFTSTSCELQVVPPFDFIGVYLFDWDPTAQNGPIVANFGLIRIECRYVVSRWVVKVCWVPGQGVRVTYRHHHRGSITVLYPGTTHADYVDFVSAPSKGHWANQFYKHRPYLVVEPSP